MRASWAAVVLLLAYAVPHRLIELAQIHQAYQTEHVDGR